MAEEMKSGLEFKLVLLQYDFIPNRKPGPLGQVRDDRF
jgi:hypothetical protein